MGRAIFKSKRAAFLRNNDAFMDMVTGHMAIDIERNLKSTSGMPVDKGHMKAATRSFKSRTGKYRVEINKEYAAVQNKGKRLTGVGAPTRQFKNYTTAGTSAGFFERAINPVLSMKSSYVTEAAKALNL